MLRRLAKGLFLAVLLLVFATGTHELTHYVIFHEFGCEDVGFMWGMHEFSDNHLWPVVGTYAEDCSKVENHGELQLAQANVENVGYQIVPFLIFITFVLIFYTMGGDD